MKGISHLFVSLISAYNIRYVQEGKLMASDRREGDMLGYAVAVDDDQGTAIVSALKATAR